MHRFLAVVSIHNEESFVDGQNVSGCEMLVKFGGEVKLSNEKQLYVEEHRCILSFE